MMFIPLIVCVLGLIMYFIASQEKVREVGKIMFWTGLLAFLLAGHYVPGSH